MIMQECSPSLPALRLIAHLAQGKDEQCIALESKRRSRVAGKVFPQAYKSAGRIVGQVTLGLAEPSHALYIRCSVGEVETGVGAVCRGSFRLRRRVSRPRSR